MTNKLEKKAMPSTEISMNEGLEILKKVNVVSPSEEDKVAFHRLLEQKPNLMKGNEGLHKLVIDQLMVIHGFTFVRSYLMNEELAAMRDDLGFQTATQIEKLLIEQICINYMRLNLLENHHNIKTTEKHFTEDGLYWEKRLDTAHRRYMRSVETLAKVRKYLAEAEFRESQAQTNRVKAAKIAGCAMTE
jgi:hypothetical protein